MTNKSLEIAMIEELFKSFREALSIPSKNDIEVLNDKIERIEQLLLKATAADKAEPVEEIPVPVEKEAPVAEKAEEAVAVPKEEAAPVAKKKPAPAKKKKPAPAKKAVATKKKKAGPGKKKEAASDKVLEVIQAQEEGADFKKIKAETKFDDKKIRNIIFRLHKLGQIEKVKRGVYKAA